MIDPAIIRKAMELYPIKIEPNKFDSRFPVDVNRQARLAWIQEQTGKTDKD